MKTNVEFLKRRKGRWEILCFFSSSQCKFEETFENLCLSIIFSFFLNKFEEFLFLVKLNNKNFKILVKNFKETNNFSKILQFFLETFENFRFFREFRKSENKKLKILQKMLKKQIIPKIFRFHKIIWKFHVFLEFSPFS